MNRRALYTLVLLFVLAACVQPGGTPPPPAPDVGLSLGGVQEGQTLSGTVAVIAGGVGGSAQGIVFELGDLTVQADANGVALLATRDLADGDYTLKAAATVAGAPVSDSLAVEVVNALPTGGSVGPDGGALGTPDGSVAILPPGAVTAALDLTVADTTQAEILQDFGVDYTALGVTFLGALTVDAGPDNGATTAVPIQVDLAGWSQAVQPGQDVIMFSVAPDADGDGVGELMFAANALASGDGSVVTTPVQQAEVYGFETGAGLRAQQDGAARPGEIVTLQGRGFLPGGVLSNVATFAGGEAILFRSTLSDSADFASPQLLELAVPALGQGEHDLRFENLTSGYRSESQTLRIGALGSGEQATWDAFVAQLTAAAEGLTDGRDALAAQATSLLADLTGATSNTASAMAANSELVSAQSLALLEAIAADSYTPEQRALVYRHALLLDAVAVSVATLAQPAADLAALLLLATPQPGSGGAALRTQQSGGGCGSGVGTDITFGTPTGMGSAPTGACSNGSAGGAGGGGSLRTQRAGSVGPVAGALVRLMIPGTAEKLTPITALTDEAGYFQIPFVPAGEPFVLQAFHPGTGEIFTADGVSGAVGELVSSPIVFSGEVAVEPGSPVASFSASPISGPFPDPFAFAFDASASSDDGTIVEYSWSFGDGESVAGPDAQLEHVYAESGSFTVTLFVTDDEGKVGSAQTTVAAVVPFPFEAGRAEMVSVLPDGTQGENNVEGLDVSDDGRVVVFTSRANNLAATPPVDSLDAFLKDMDGGSLTRVTEAADGTAANARPSNVAVSGDGSLVAFDSGADNLVPNDTNGVGDIFLKDPASGAIEISRPSGRIDDMFRPSLDGDGSVVVYENGSFIFIEDLDQGTSTSFQGNRASITPDGRFVVFQRLGRVLVRDLQTDDEFVASAAADGTLSSGFDATVSSDGRFVAFVSTANILIPGVDPAPQCCFVYVKDLQTGDITLASSDVLGTPGDRGSGGEEPSISGDGRYLVFSSGATNLVPERFLEDFGRSSTVYVKDLATGWVAHVPTTFDGSLYDDTSEAARISEDGRYIVFVSGAPNLVAGDDNDHDDIFRVENPLWTPPAP